MGQKILLSITAFLILLQFIPVNRDNPPAESQIQLSSDIEAIFQRACYDCHSHQTIWPWYAYVAPISMWVSHHVDDGRGGLNLSKWGKYSLKKKLHKLDEIKEVLEVDEMPLWEYTLLHSSAKLSNIDKQKIYEWVDMEKKKLANLTTK